LLGLSEQEAARAVAFAVKRLSDRGGEGLTLTSLRRGFGAAVETAVARFGDLRCAIVTGGFALVFQPIVALADRRPHHYEVLARFPEGPDPFEVVRFGEEIGLIEELDLAICRKAIAVLEQNPALALAVNLSGRSVESAGFRGALAELLRAHCGLHHRLIFELTESYAIERVAEAASFLAGLREQGCALCLDDFGAGAAAYHYLRHFEIDFVKIDGPFLKAAGTHPRDRALVRSICQLCRELGIGVIGEMIEDEAACTAAAALGIGYGQGRLFGAPAAAIPGEP